MWREAYPRTQIPRALKALLIFGLFLGIFSETCVATTHSEARIHGENFPVAQPEWILEIRKTTIIKGIEVSNEESELQRRNRIVEIDNEKAHLLRRLQKPAKNKDYTKGHLRYRLLTAIDGFQRFGKIAEARIQQKRESYGQLSHSQKQVRIQSTIIISCRIG